MSLTVSHREQSNLSVFKKRSVGLQYLMFRKCYFQTKEKSLTEECRASDLEYGNHFTH